MVVSSSTNPEEQGRLFGDFTKGTKEGGGGGARALQHLPPAGQGWAETLKEGDSAPKKGPRRQGEGPALPPPRPPPRKEANRAETTPPGKARGAAAPGLTPEPGLLVPRGRDWVGGGEARSLPPTRVPQKSRRDLSPTAFHCQDKAVIGGGGGPQASPSRIPRGYVVLWGPSPAPPELVPSSRPQRTRRVSFVEVVARDLGMRARRCGGPGASHLIRGRELQLIDIEGRHQGDGVEAILQQGLLGALLREIVPQLHHGSGRPEAAACVGKAGRGSPRAGPARCPGRRRALASGEGSRGREGRGPRSAGERGQVPCLYRRSRSGQKRQAQEGTAAGEGGAAPAGGSRSIPVLAPLRGRRARGPPSLPPGGMRGPRPGFPAEGCSPCAQPPRRPAGTHPTPGSGRSGLRPRSEPPRRRLLLAAMAEAAPRGAGAGAPRDWAPSSRSPPPFLPLPGVNCAR